MTTPRALLAPQEPVVLITEAQLQQALETSRRSERKRVIFPFHKGPEDLVHRMFNAMQPGTYIRPHRHRDPPKSEVFLVLRGELDFLVFAEDGALELVQRLRAGSDVFGIDLAAGMFHSMIPRAPDTVIYEVKPGPYSAASDKDFATWAPSEGDPDVPRYQASLEAAVLAWTAR